MKYFEAIAWKKQNTPIIGLSAKITHIESWEDTQKLANHSLSAFFKQTFSTFLS